MTSPVRAATASGSQTTSVSLHPITLPAGLSATDLVIAVLTTNANIGVAPLFTASDPSWTPLPVVVRSGISQIAYWKVAAGGDSLTISTNDFQTHSSHITYRITGHGSAVVQAGATGSSTNADPPSATMSGAAQDNLAIAVCGNAGTVVASAAPSGYSNLVTKAGDAGGFSTSAAEKALSASNTENPGAFTTTSTAWAAQTLIVASTAITTNARETQEVVESLSQVDPNMVVTQEVVESVSANALTMLATQVVAEMVSTNVPNDSGRRRPVIIGN